MIYENTYSQSFNICQCQIFYTQYLLTFKIFYLYNRIIKFVSVEDWQKNIWNVKIVVLTKFNYNKSKIIISNIKLIEL